MAQVAQDRNLDARIDLALEMAHREWASVPVLAEEWPAWDEHSRFSLIMDWPVSEDRLAQLAGWLEQGCLSPDQEARYAALLALVEQHRPALARLLEE